MIILKVEWQQDGQVTSAYATDDAPLVFGRHPDCDVVLDDPHASRRHASVFYHRGAFRLHNLSQINPIIFNDRWQLPYNQNVLLQAGDSFQLGNLRVRAIASTTFPFARQAPALLHYRCTTCGNELEQPGRACSWCGANLDGPAALAIDLVKEA
ncbi:MAG: FHA domain-containing protein [Candidatus Promineifilaceae bacterium]|nr:FHA domain-containing protein [Candidatus Promineifilaceae bacterium]